MTLFLIYLSGFILMTMISYAILKDRKDVSHTKKYWFYQSCKQGLLSWIGILFIITAAVVGLFFTVDNKIEKKLDDK